MEMTNINSAAKVQILAKVMYYAENQGYQLDQWTEAGYNEHSGYIWVANENWGSVSFGIADYAYYRGEEVECILYEPFEGEEFFGANPEDCIKQYKEWAAERLAADEIAESDILEF
jgi:hypothetical protein